MSEVKRYGHQQYHGKIWLEERDDGKFCSYQDYANLKAQLDFKQNLTEQVVALQKQCDALAAENVALSRYFSSSAGAVEYWNSWADAEDKLASVPETPATEAYLNSVRAEGVEMFASAVQGGCAVGDRVKDLADMFAAQLRAGEPS